MTAPPAFEAEDLAYAYPDGTRGFGPLSFSIARGSFTVLLGANGTGKSTLLLSLLGFLPARGAVRVLGEPLTRETFRSLRARAGIVFQSPDDQLFCTRVEDDVAFGPLNLGWEPARVRAAVAEALKQVGLEGYADRVPHHLSLGEKKKVALASVLAMAPEALLLDEPTSALDPRSAGRVIDILAELRARGATILAATHDLHLAGAVADRVLILGEDHTLAADGAPEAILGDAELLVRHNLAHAHAHRHGGEVHRHPHGHEAHEHGDET